MRLMITFVGLLLTSFSLAQEVAPISFETMRHDFGTIKEEDGPVIYEFKFINNLDSAIKIQNVRASCGCTTPAWTRESVEPGASGFIQAQYNPRNRPGNFNKSLTVSITGQPNPVRLYISGSVTGRPKSVEEEYRNDLNGLRLKYSTLNIGRVFTKDEPTTKQFEIYNDTQDTLRLLDKTISPDYVAVQFNPASIAPKTRGFLQVSYNAKLKNDLGFMSDNITFYTDQNEEIATKSLTVYATVMEYFPPLTAEMRAKAPRLMIESNMHDLERMKQGEVKSVEVKLTNNGASELNIRKIDANCDCVKGTVPRMDIAPQGSITLTITLDATKRRGNQQKSVTLYTNDPLRPVQRISVKAYVESED